MLITVLAFSVGVVVGLTIGALGAGGSVLTVPALVFLVGVEPYVATTLSLVVVGAASFAGAAVRIRARQVRWRDGLAFCAAGVVPSIFGSVLGRRIEPDLLMVFFSLLVFLVAPFMMSGMTDESADVKRCGGTRSTIRHIGLVVTVGSAVGFLTGMLGVGGGFLIVPAFLLVFGWDIRTAIGTSLLVVATNSAVALAERIGDSVLEAKILVLLAFGVIIGVVVGHRIGALMSSKTLARAFAAVLFVVGTYSLTRSVSQFV